MATDLPVADYIGSKVAGLPEKDLFGDEGVRRQTPRVSCPPISLAARDRLLYLESGTHYKTLSLNCDNLP